MKKIITLGLVVGLVGMASFVYAADIQSPSEIVCSLTGKTIEEVQSERADGKTYGTIAKDSDKLDEFKEEVLEQKKSVLDERVESGDITQEEADEIYNQIQENQVDCDGTGLNGLGKGLGLGFGNGDGNGNGLNYEGGGQHRQGKNNQNRNY